MKQVIQSTRTGKLNLKEVPEPSVKAGNILVSTRASLISAGTERMVVKFARKSLAGKARERPDLLKKVGVQPRDSEQLKLSRIETSDVQPSPAVQHDRATV